MPSYLVTGASKGIGREFVKQLSENNLNTVFAIVRDPEQAIRLKEEVGSKSNVYILKGNATDPTSLVNVAKQVSEITDGQLDVLINNANTLDRSSIALKPSQFPLEEKATHDAFAPSLSTALYGVMWSTNAFLPLLEKGEQKKVINITSGLGSPELIRKSAMAMQVPYAVSKASMNMLVASYGAELEPKGIKVIGLSPGWVDTWEVPGPLPEQLIQFRQLLLQHWHRAGLKDTTGPMDVVISVKAQLQVIEKLDISMTGKIWSHEGSGNSSLV